MMCGLLTKTHKPLYYNMNENKEATKAVRGPGGIKCPCCRASKTVKEARTLHNRILRHRTKAALIGAGREEA